jgi:hypothetical protein
MGTSLSGLTPANTYTGLLKFGDNSAISASLKVISDGAGNDTILSLSTTSLNIGGTGLSARVGIKGSGSTSATTSLLVQNSAGTNLLSARDDGRVGIGTSSPSFPLDVVTPNGTVASMRLFQTGANVLEIYAGINSRIVNNSGGGAPSNAGIILDVSNNVGINTNPNSSAQLDVSSTTKGFLPPRMTTTQKNAISSPAAGLVVYDSTLAKLCVYTTTWETITSL